MAATTVDVATVTDSINRARGEIDSQEEALKRISDNIIFMDGAWDSDAQRVYTDKFQTAKTEVENFNQTVRENLQEMQSFVDGCASVDDSVARSLQGVNW